ncbi:MAG: PilZ domain-containing protein [Thermomonas sp.]|jgi:hypothetical protein|uniref:PilZ domain-containing protein n=1 Tax=Thermomonas sp. TaxID=1971895 RepID=UPI001EB571E6|nr:PilZ domain-containing protein [Thermomonas sp.]MBV2208764.1 PilZ domain-containing protein [Thermomonas sp.]
MGAESRRQPRRSVQGRVEVFDTVTEEVVGQLGNVSVGGMLLIANRSLPDDALFQFRFNLPDSMGASRPLELGAHVLWKDRAAAPGQFWVGLRFLGASADDAHRLKVWTAQPEG